VFFLRLSSAPFLESRVGTIETPSSHRSYPLSTSSINDSCLSTLDRSLLIAGRRAFRISRSFVLSISAFSSLIDTSVISNNDCIVRDAFGLLGHSGVCVHTSWIHHDLRYSVRTSFEPFTCCLFSRLAFCSAYSTFRHYYNIIFERFIHTYRSILSII
jgi:hypothetical protein